MQVSITGAPVLHPPPAPFPLSTSPLTNTLLRPPASTLKKTSVLWCKENLCPQNAARLLPKTYNPILEGILSAQEFSSWPSPIFGSWTKRVPYTSFSTNAPPILNGTCLCHLITKYADDQNVTQGSHLVFFLLESCKKIQICLANSKFKTLCEIL